MVVNERAVGGVDVVVWGGLSGRRGEEWNEGHLGGKSGGVERMRGRGGCGAKGSTKGPGTDEADEDGTTCGIYAFQITKQSL